MSQGWSAVQSALDPHGIQAQRILSLYRLHHWIDAVVYALVMLAFFAAILRGRKREVPDTSKDTHQRLRMIVTVAGVATVVVLFVLLVASVSTGRAVSRLPTDNAVVIKVTGYQWWWRFEYEDEMPARRVRTANEIHIPVGRPVILKAESNDVIHSFWVPSLHGKVDLIPSHTTTRVFQADAPGVYRGQCAEFCGLQHAHMALLVIAEPEEEYRQWYVGQLQPAAAPNDRVRQRGQQVFTQQACTMCHTIRGTDANGMTAPDLTHVGSRLTIAAGTLPNTRGHLAGWIVDPQGVKPGNHMPSNGVAPDDLQALLSYLEGLK